MQKIHFYKKNKLVYSVWANSIEEVELNPLEYYQNFTTDMIISAIEYKYPVLDKGNLREATREELVAKGVKVALEAGEIIENQKLVKIPQPSQYHEWNGDKWTCCLETLKNKKREELKEIRKEKIDSDLEVNGDFFQVRERDLQNFYNLKIAVDLEPARSNMRTAWVLADNSIKEFSFTELMGVLGAYILRKQQLFTKFGELCARLDSCNTVEEIESIKWK